MPQTELPSKGYASNGVLRTSTTVRRLRWFADQTREGEGHASSGHNGCAVSGSNRRRGRASSRRFDRAEYIAQVDPICESFVGTHDAAVKAYNKDAKRWEHLAGRER